MPSSNSDAVFQVSINGQIFSIAQPTISGAQIRALAGLSDQDMIVREHPGPGADHVVADDQEVRLERGELVYFFSHPPTVFG